MPVQGRNVILDQTYGAPRITKDGVSVAKEIEFKDRSVNLGAQVSSCAVGCPRASASARLRPSTPGVQLCVFDRLCLSHLLPPLVRLGHSWFVQWRTRQTTRQATARRQPRSLPAPSSAKAARRWRQA